MKIRFYYNGIKADNGKLIKCYYSLDNNPERAPMVTITCKSVLDRLPNELTPINNTDITTDYIDYDYARLVPGNFYYEEARKAAIYAEIKSAKKEIEHYEKLLAKGTRHNELYKNEIDFYNQVIDRYK